MMGLVIPLTYQLMLSPKMTRFWKYTQNHWKKSRNTSVLTFIISQNGADAHAYDPLTHLCCSMKIFEEIPKLVHRLAHKFCNGKWVALGGGGYDIWRVVPRAWAQLWNVAN